MHRYTWTCLLVLTATTAGCVDGGGEPTAGSTGETGAPATGGTGEATGASGTTDGGSDPTTGGGETGGSGGATDSGGETADPWTPASCFDAWDLVAEQYPDAGALVACTEVAGGEIVARSLLVLDGITIDNNGQTMQPCVEARCDPQFAYVATNALPHYDFVQTTPNALVENQFIYRIPLAPMAIGAVDAEDAAAIDGCVDAYDQYLTNANQATTREPSGFCIADAQDPQYLADSLEAGGTATYKKINCLNTTAFTTNGSPVFGPNEAAMPDPWGSPLFFMPDTAGQPYIPDPFGDGAALDLCGGHTANSMHYHGVNEACFERSPSGAPANSYAEAAQAWDMSAMLQGPCTEESGIVGWSLDGYPIKGACVCTARDQDGACTEVKRARSSWLYAGLGSWGNSPQEAGALGIESSDCTADADCCPGGEGCNFRCSYVPVASGDDTAIAQRCTLVDYSWCTHRFVDRSAQAGDGFVYLDRCNGFEGPDGYAYHATASFPYVTGCFRGEPQAAPGGGGGMMGGGGMNPPMCTMPGQMMCCGDDFCGGPETAQNCPADCG